MASQVELLLFPQKGGSHLPRASPPRPSDNAARKRLGPVFDQDFDQSSAGGREGTGGQRVRASLPPPTFLALEHAGLTADRHV